MEKNNLDVSIANTGGEIGLNSRNNELSDRKKTILKAIIEAHVLNGEPVGSKFLTQNKQIACSSATIRNEMAELESMGYLEQPHTSAGRIPSEAGYRFYVDWLVDRYNFTQGEIAELQRSLKQKQAELDTIIGTAMSLAAKLTSYTALAIKPRQARITVQKYEMMRLDDTTFVLIMVIGSTVKTKYVRTNAPIPNEAAALLVNMLNKTVTGVTASEITLPMLMEMERMMGEYDFLVSPVIKAICEAIAGSHGGEIKFEGINRLLAYPDFYDTARLRDMLALFERKDDLFEMIATETDNSNGVQVYNGRENIVKVIDNSTLIFKTIHDHGRPVGAIGIIGPTRMDYRRVISTVDQLTSGVSALLSSSDDDDDI